MRRFFQFFVSLYVWITGAITFSLASIVALIAFSVTTKKKALKIHSFMLRSVFFFSFIRVKVIHEEKFDKTTPAIFMCNHISIYDIPLMGAYIPVYANAIEAESHFKWPVYKHLIKAYGQIPINRDSVRDSLKSIQIAQERLKEGVSIIIFPEGHRTDDGEMQEFKKLPFLLAKRSGVRIVPLSISGMWHLSPNDKFVKRPTKLLFKFGKTISSEEIKNTDIDVLIKKTYNRILSMRERK